MGCNLSLRWDGDFIKDGFRVGDIITVEGDDPPKIIHGGSGSIVTTCPSGKYRIIEVAPKAMGVEEVK